MALLSRSQALQRQAEQIIPQLDAQATELKLRLNEGVQALSRWIELLREAGVHEDQEIKGEDQRLNTDPESYRRTLAMKLGVKLDDLLSWYQRKSKPRAPTSSRLQSVKRNAGDHDDSGPGAAG